MEAHELDSTSTLDSKLYWASEGKLSSMDDGGESREAKRGMTAFSPYLYPSKKIHAVKLLRTAGYSMLFLKR
jgi:hypothetical protein